MAVTQFVGRIYKLTPSETNNIYVGSTTLKLGYRMREHKHNYGRHLNAKFPYTTAFEILKYTDAKIELLFEGQCNSKSDLFKLEGEYIQATENCINKQLAGVNYKENSKAYNKEYYKNNQDIIKQRSKEYYENNKEAISQKIKEKIIANPEENKNRCKVYYEKNKDKLTAKFTCEVCGSVFAYRQTSDHIKTQKHKTAMDAKKIEPEAEDNLL